MQGRWRRWFSLFFPFSLFPSLLVLLLFYCSLSYTTSLPLPPLSVAILLLSLLHNFPSSPSSLCCYFTALSPTQLPFLSLLSLLLFYCTLSYTTSLPLPPLSVAILLHSLLHNFPSSPSSLSSPLLSFVPFLSLLPFYPPSPSPPLQIQGHQGGEMQDRDDWVPDLPHCKLSELVDILSLVTSVSPFQCRRDNLAVRIENQGYIAKLLDLFHKCEDLEDITGLHILYNIFKAFFLFNNASLLQVCGAKQVCGANIVNLIFLLHLSSLFLSLLLPLSLHPPLSISLLPVCHTLSSVRLIFSFCPLLSLSCPSLCQYLLGFY